MMKVNVADAKAHLSEYLAAVQGGNTVVICNRNQPIAELRAVAQPERKPRPIGLAKGKFKVTAAFFEPLPDDVIAAFRAER